MKTIVEDLSIAEKRRMNKDVIAISQGDYLKHGCPYCNYKYGTSSIRYRGSSKVDCSKSDCGKHFIVVADDCSRSTIGLNSIGLFVMGPDLFPDVIYPWVLPHPCPDREAWEPKDPGPNEDGSENFYSRGIGFDCGHKCFVTGQPITRGSNISGYVDFKESGERVVAMFGEIGGAWLDYREYEPTYIQVKILCTEGQISCLERLHELTKAAGNKITPAMIEEARSLRNDECL